MSSRPADLPRPAAPVRAPATAALAAAAVAADVVFDPVHRHVPLCPLHAATGLWCPLCGGLRAVDALVHGNVATAMHVNLLVVAAVPLLMAWWLVALTRGHHDLPRRRVPRIAIGALVALVLAFGITRNLTWGHALRTS